VAAAGGEMCDGVCINRERGGGVCDDVCMYVCTFRYDTHTTHAHTHTQVEGCVMVFAVVSEHFASSAQCMKLLWLAR
jgi:hypothetical protein